MSHRLRLVEDRLTAGAHCAGTLPRLNRVLYVAQGDVIVTSGRPETRVAAGGAWHGGAVCSVRAGDAGARVLRFELYPDPAPELNGGVLTLDHPIDLDPRAAWLMRCDRVDFAPGGEAPLHRHRGGGIRCLLRGTLRVESAGEVNEIGPGGAWFESGPDPVLATASSTELTGFARVMILPRELKGKSSIRYVKAEDGDKPKTQRYQVFADEPIAP